MEFEDINFNIDNFINKNNLNFNMESFYKIRNIVNDAFKVVGINYSNMKMFYQRFSDGKSLLSIKVIDGNDNDKENYMFNYCHTEYYGKNVFCNVYLHADKKCSDIVVKLMKLISKNIVAFFEEVENNLNKNNITNLECSFMIPLENKKMIDDNTQEKSKIKKLIYKIIKIRK